MGIIIPNCTLINVLYNVTVSAASLFVEICQKAADSVSADFGSVPKSAEVCALGERTF